MQSLEKIEEKRLKLLTDRQHKLLDKAMSSLASGCKKEETKIKLSNLLREKKNNEHMSSCWLYCR